MIAKVTLDVLNLAPSLIMVWRLYKAIK